jgi:hypothetical protein
MNNRIPPPVRPAHFLVLITEFLAHLSSAVTTFLESLLELSIYHANRKVDESQAWEQMAQDLETLEEDR